MTDQHDIIPAGDAPMVQRPEGPGAWIGRMLDSGRSPEDLKELFALYKEEQRDIARKAFIVAMGKFHANLPTIRRDATGKVATRGGSSFSYMYSKLETIAAAIKRPLAEAGLSYHWENNDPVANHVSVSCVVEHGLGHSVTASATFPLETGGAGMSAQQAVISATTYAQRNSLVLALGLTTAADDLDGAEPKSKAQVTHITEAEVRSLNDLLIQTATELSRFKAHYKVDSLSELTADQYKLAVTQLQAKLAKGTTNAAR